MQSELTNILTIQFANEVSQQDIPKFRGAVIHMLESKPILFHNHNGETFRYAYPLIQYKRIKGKAAIVCVGKGVEEVHHFFSSNHFQYTIGKKKMDMLIESIHADMPVVKITKVDHHYQLHNWLPLNTCNYELYKEADSLVSRVQLLENILTGNILSLLKGIGVHLDDILNVHIVQINRQGIATYKKLKLMSFDIEFKANITLPPLVGIGKNASIGFGIITS